MFKIFNIGSDEAQKIDLSLQLNRPKNSPSGSQKEENESVNDSF
jgi:hypothetical protein